MYCMILSAWRFAAPDKEGVVSFLPWVDLISARPAGLGGHQRKEEEFSFIFPRDGRGGAKDPRNQP